MQKKSKSKIITDMKKLESWVNCLETSRKRSQKGKRNGCAQDGRKVENRMEAWLLYQPKSLQLTV